MGGPVTSDFAAYASFWRPWMIASVVCAVWVCVCLGILAWKALR